MNVGAAIFLARWVSALSVSCICLPAMLATSGFAQYRFDHWTADNGLPQNSVRDILQTRDGYLWLTTFDGLVRFDGVRFTVFNKGNSPGIDSNRFVQLFEDKFGDLWAAMENGGLVRLHQGQFTTYLAAPNEVGAVFWSVGEDGQGNLMTTSGNQFLRWLDGGFQPANDLRLPASKSPDGWAGRAQHLPLRLEANERIFCFVDGQVRSWTKDELPIAQIAFQPVADRRGNVWFGVNDALIQITNGRVVQAHTNLPGKQPRIFYGNQNPLQAFSRDAQGNLWLTELDSMRSRLMAQQPPDGLDSGIYADREGNYWFGSFNNGLFRARQQTITAYTEAQGLVAKEVYPLLQDRTGRLWIGTAENGLYCLNDGHLTNYSGLGSFSSNVTALYEDSAGRVWVNGGWAYEGGRFVQKITPDVWTGPTIRFVYSMYEDHDGGLWIGGEGGLVRYQNGVVTPFTMKDGLAGEGAKVIIGDAADGIWLGSYGGLTHYRNGEFTRWTEKEGLPGNTVRALKQEADGTLWIGTYDSGLGRFKDGRFTRYTAKDGLFDNGVFQILEDDYGWFWMSCNRGIYRVRKQELNDFAEGKIKTISSLAYGKSDGMPSAECNGGRWPAGIKTSDGKLWFPTMGGMAMIDPATVRTNTQPPPVVVEEVKINNQPVPPESWRSALTIRPGQENFEIQYTALSFINSENLRFKYKLEGADHDWVEAGTRRTAYFSHVAPGTYTFKVIAANSDGIWNTEGKTIRITVLPSFYRTWWFLTLAALGGTTAVWLAVRFRLQQLHRRHAQQQAFSRRLIESQESERKRIAAGLHDSLGQQLLVIKNWAMIGLNVSNGSAQAREPLDEISVTASQAIEEVREVIYDLRPYQLDKIGLANTIRFMVEKVAAASGIQFQTDLGAIDGLFSQESEVTLYRIVQECVNNIVKHSRATAARVAIDRHDESLSLTVEDNGRGFAPEAAGNGSHGGFGMTGLRERVRMLGGKQTIHSAPGGGTKIHITVEVEKTQ